MLTGCQHLCREHYWGSKQLQWVLYNVARAVTYTCFSFLTMTNR